jgi:GTPase
MQEKEKTKLPLKTEIGIAITGNVDSGKCFGKGTLIMKFNGSLAKVEDIKVGDLLMGDDSMPRKVLEVHQGHGTLYDIIPNFLCDTVNYKYKVNGEHILCLKDNITSKIITISVNDFLKLDNQEQYSICFEAVEYCNFQDISDPFKYGLNILKSENGENTNISIHSSYKYNTKINRLKLLNGIAFANRCDIYPTTLKVYNDIIIEKKYKILIGDIICLIKSLGFFITNYDEICVEEKKNMIRIKFIRDEIEIDKLNRTVGINIRKSSEDTYYGFSTNHNKKFLLKDFSVSHNSSFIGVMKYGVLDDGNGSARKSVAKHPHEIASGKTSDISTRLIECDDGKHGITMIDLCGHEKYLKTTTYGLNGYFPDYAFVIIAANRGVMKMTREHMGILFFLNIPTIILITRTDLVVGTDIYKNTLKNIKTICKRSGRQVKIVNTDKEFELTPEELQKKEIVASQDIIKLCDQFGESTNIIPIISISNKTGYYLNTVRTFINNIQPRKLWDISKTEGTIFYIDQVFNKIGLGIVISGIVKGNTINIGDKLYVGPNIKNFIQVKVKSIHNDNRQDVTKLENHQRGCLAITSLDKSIEFNRSVIKRGMICLYPETYMSYVCYRFRAEIEILNHSATIKNGYSPFIHYGPVCQTAKLTINKEENNGKDELRIGDIAIVNFKFKFKPEFIEPFRITEKYFFFREGMTRGRGKILEITPITEDSDPNPDPVKIKRRGNKNKKFKKQNKQNRNSNILKKT